MRESKKTAKTLFSVAEHIIKQWEKISNIEILNQEAIINVLNSTIDYELALKIPSNFWALSEEPSFNDPNIIRIVIAQLNPYPKTMYGMIQKSPDSYKYSIIPEMLPSDVEIISMKTTYRIDNIESIENLIDATSTHDPGGNNKNEYWMHAQLKDPQSLIEKFGRFDVRDVDVTVGVSILEELNTSIPSPFVSRLKAVFDILNEKDPRQQWRAIPRLRASVRQSYSGREFEILKEIEGLFLPRAFSKYVDVREDFRYDTCHKGSEAYELPIELIPKTMDVVSRADLTLEKPASEGTLIYQEVLFRDALSSLFERI